MNGGAPFTLTHEPDQPILFSDDWTLDSINVAETHGLDQDLVTNYALNSSTTDRSQDGTFLIFNPPGQANEPEIVTGYRDHRSDITVLLGGRSDPASVVDVVWLEIFGLRVEFDPATRDLFIFSGSTGTPTRLEFGRNQAIQGPTSPGTPILLVVRYNAQLDLITLFIGPNKVFEESTSVTGVASSGTGLRMSAGADWGGINTSAAQTDRRGARVVAAAIPDSRIRQLVGSVVQDVRSIDFENFGLTLGRAALRVPDDRLIFGNIVTAGYDVVRDTDCLLYTSPSPRDKRQSRMPSSA